MNTTLNGELRVSDADRDLALAELSEHFQSGRLDGDEFEERSGRALRARTAGELADLFVDLPRNRAQAPVPASVGTGGVMPAHHSRGLAVLAGVVAVSLIAFVADVVGGHHGYSPVGYGGPGVAGIVVVLLAIRFAARRHH
jgi:Domain of unknown function (DUF1707)